MSPVAPPRIGDDDVYIVTERGNRELNAGDTALSVNDLQVLVLVDGFSPVAQVAYNAPDLKRADVDAALQRLMADKLIMPVDNSGDEIQGAAFSTIKIPVGFFSSLRDDGAAGSTILKKKGYYVRIARRPSDRPAASGKAPLVLVVDDDVDLQKLIRTYFSMEGIGHRAAFKRDDIAIALRQPPPPDLILLDVNLPDADGFDILVRMRAHPALRKIPIIMLTAEASREAVLKGLKVGADGYITKPFEPDVLIGALKTVLGLAINSAEPTLPGTRKP